MGKKMTFAAVGAVMMIAALFVTQTTATETVLNVRKPEQPVVTTTAGVPEASGALALPILVPPSRKGEVAQPAAAAITAADKRPVAQFASAPAGARSVYVTLPPQTPEVTDKPGFQFLSSIRHEINGQTVYVTTARPNALASQKQLALGNKTVTLRNGTTAYAISNGPPTTPNVIVWAKDDLIITVAGTLSLDQIQNLAAQVVVKQG